MNLLTKEDFIDIYRNNGNALASPEIKKIAELTLEKTDLPKKNDENWIKTDIKSLLKHKYNYGKKISLDKMIVSLYNLSGTYANVIVFINGHFCPNFTKIIDDKELLIFENLKTAKSSKPELFKKYFNKTEVHKKHYFSALNTAYVEDGAFIMINKNSKIENPIHIYHFSDGENSKITSLSRNLIIAEEGSKSNILFSYHSLSENYEYTNVSTEIFIDKNAYLDFNIFQGEGDDAFQINHTNVHQQKDSQFYSNTATMCGNIVKNDINVKILGENAYSELNGIYLPDRDQQFTNNICVEHSVGHSISKQFYRGILDNNAKAVFYGKALINKNAVKSEAYQKNNNILLSKHAKVHSKPHLIIHNDDVSASHGSTVGQLDQEAMYYMRTRGIGEKRAKMILLEAFVEEVVNKIKIPQYNFYLKFLIENRLKGEKIDTMCAKMGVCRK
ncbi:MAG: Fe-S cluster assembly protein SufD [Bacteroidota bacterium]|nr:Fe-S cluster assembly protein SufD [Bacteroidota bacterium]